MQRLILCLLTLIALSASPLSHATEAALDPCFNRTNQYNSECRNRYHYDNLTMYFRDAANLEQTVFVKRVISRATGKLMHADYDFSGICTNHCNNLAIMTEEFLWAFRNAVVENRFYVKEVVDVPCDPTLEICCDDNGICSENHNDGPQPEPFEQSNQSADQPESLAGAKQKSKQETIDKNIQRTESVTNIFSKIASRAQNAFNFKNEATSEKVMAARPLFTFMSFGDSGSYQICRMTGQNVCERLEGRINVYAGNAFADIQHTLGNEENDALKAYVKRFFRDYHGVNTQTCTTTTSCGHENGVYKCSIKLSCSTP